MKTLADIVLIIKEIVIILALLFVMAIMVNACCNGIYKLIG